MLLPTNQLEAFFEVAQTLNFSKAAKNLHITQSALSQRIINLESLLELSLFVRDSAGVRLTDAGETLLRHCQIRSGLEQDLLGELRGAKTNKIAGSLRIGGFSSVMWSVIVPALGKLVRDHPDIHVEAMAREMHDLPRLLRIGEIDFAVIDHKLDRNDLECHLLGMEENVLVEPIKGGERASQFLDHDPDDQVTITYLNIQGQRKVKIHRSFLDDVYGLIAGVSQGWGSAVIPRHLVGHCKNVKIIKTSKPLKIPLYLHYYSQPYYSKTHLAVVETLTNEAHKFLQP